MSSILNCLKFDVEETVKAGTTLLIGKPRVYEKYEDGVKAGLGGLSYPCLFEGLNFEKLSVKVPGSTEPQINYKNEPIPVTFEGLEGKLWQDFKNGGEVKLSLTAKGIVPVEEKTRPRINKEGKE